MRWPRWRSPGPPDGHEAQADEVARARRLVAAQRAKVDRAARLASGAARRRDWLAERVDEALGRHA